MNVNKDLLFKIAKLERDVATLHGTISDLLAKNLMLMTENESLKQRLAVANDH